MGSSSRCRQPHILRQNTIKSRIICWSYEHGWKRARNVGNVDYGLWQASGWDAPHQDKRACASINSNTNRRCMSLSLLDGVVEYAKHFDLQLALKHRQNKSQRQRIIVFSCSPIYEDQKDLVTLAKKMKKMNVSIDFIAFGDLEPETIKKLEAFNENVKGGNGSHLEIIQPGPSLLSDHIISTPILAGEGVAPRGGDTGAEGGGDAGGGGFDFGVDPSADPELALALRMSMEEEKARQEKEGKAGGSSKEPGLEGIPEEGGESQPLLDGDGEASGSADAPVTRPEEEEKKDKPHDTDLDNLEKKDDDRDPDTMDTA